MKKLFSIGILVLLAFRISYSQNIKRDTLDFAGKKITAFIVYNVAEYFIIKQPGEKVIVKTENYKAIENDLEAWSRMTGYQVRIVERKNNCTIYEFIKGQKINKDKKFAIVISENGLEQLLSPLGLAISCGLSGYNVNIYFQGPAVKVLTKGFKEKLPGFNSIFSGFARSGLEKIGHVPAQQKLKVLQELGAKFYVCQPSMEHFGAREKDFAFDNLILCEYLTFLEVYNTADLKLFLQ
jgi:predicted peroxiredoxin